MNSSTTCINKNCKNVIDPSDKWKFHVVGRRLASAYCNKYYFCEYAIRKYGHDLLGKNYGDIVVHSNDEIVNCNAGLSDLLDECMEEYKKRSRCRNKKCKNKVPKSTMQNRILYMVDGHYAAELCNKYYPLGEILADFGYLIMYNRRVPSDMKLDKYDGEINLNYDEVMDCNGV